MLLSDRDNEGQARKVETYPKLQLALLVTGVLLLAGIASMQLMMLRGFTQLADNVNSKSQTGLDTISRFSDLQEPVQHLITQGSRLLSNPSSQAIRAFFDPWTNIQLLRHGVPYVLNEEALPGVVRLLDTLQSASFKSKLQNVATQMSKMTCTTMFDCNKTANEIWGANFQSDVNNAYQWVKMALDVWPATTADEVMSQPATEPKQLPTTCNNTDIWSDLICTVEMAGQHFDGAQWSRTAQRCINVVQKLKGNRFIVQAYWQWVSSWPRGQWQFRQPVEYTDDVHDALGRIEAACKLWAN